MKTSIQFYHDFKNLIERSLGNTQPPATQNMSKPRLAVRSALLRERKVAVTAFVVSDCFSRRVRNRQVTRRDQITSEKPA
jgi:hypothetical protein